MSAGVISMMMLVTMAGAWAAEPLDPGRYDLVFGGQQARLVVDAMGVPSIVSDEGLVVTLEKDELGRVLDELTVDTISGPVRVEILNRLDGSFEQLTDPDRASRAGQLPDDAMTKAMSSPIVLIVRACAPTGPQAVAAGWPSHGTVLSAATSGIELPVRRVAPDGVSTTKLYDLSTLAGAYALCADVRPEAAKGDPNAADDRPGAGR